MVMVEDDDDYDNKNNNDDNYVIVALPKPDEQIKHPLKWKEHKVTDHELRLMLPHL